MHWRISHDVYILTVVYSVQFCKRYKCAAECTLRVRACVRDVCMFVYKLYGIQYMYCRLYLTCWREISRELLCFNLKHNEML
mmetsp:Transcript_8598/g.16131  ORF Transcript_8598/g.16131 Transcript_8598/m.16131 type:complete len:82 (+) Transcript_8598:1289-1534(+)